MVQEHKKLITILNQFSIAHDYAMSEEFEKGALDELVSYTKYHFDYEEKLMSENNYPDFEEHQSQHKNMIEQVNRFVKTHQKKGREPSH